MKSVLKLSSKKYSLEIPIIGAATTLVVFGLTMIYDASVVAAFRDFGDKLYYFKNQLLWASLGFVALGFFSFFNYHKLIKFAPAIFLLSLFLLIAVLIPGIGAKIYGARRWISFANFTFQPSEFAKLALIFYQVSIISRFQNYRMRLLDTATVFFLPTFILAALVLLEPDLGTVLIFAGITFAVYFIGQAPLWHFVLAIPALMIASLIAIIAQPYRLTRLEVFLDPNFDPQGASYQINQILKSLANGGILGVGLGASRGKFDFIPEVHSDAIFAVVAEELGFVGAVFLIGLLLFLIIKSTEVAKNAGDFEGKIMASAIATLFGTQAFLNLASVVALIPLTGIPLPFISYGGSSLVVTLSAVGILINIRRNS